VDTGEEISCSFIITRRNRSELLKFGKEIFDQVVCFIVLTLVVAGYFTARFRRNHHRIILARKQGDDQLIGDAKVVFGGLRS